MVRLVDGPAYARLLALSGVITVLITRAYLAATGYPKMGNGTLHIGRVLWGGLLMLAALLIALVLSGHSARRATALLGGAGLGLFVDEIGKYLTRTNDYFFRPAAGIIYVLFTGLLLLAWHLGRWRPASPDTRLANAAHIAATGLASGLTARQRQAALRLLDGRDDSEGRAVSRLIEAVPARRPSIAWLLARRPVEAVARLADRPRLVAVVLAVYALGESVTAVVFVVQALIVATGGHLAQGTDEHTVVVQAFTRTLSAILAMTGIVRWRTDQPAATRWLRTAVLVDLLFTQVFNFTDSQFTAVLELPFELLVLALTSYRTAHWTEQ